LFVRSPTANSYHELAAVRLRWRGRPHGSAIVSIFSPYGIGVLADPLNLPSLRPQLDETAQSSAAEPFAVR
jgi:hypothetical protein